MKTQSEPRKVDLRVVDVVARYEMKRHGKLTGVVVYEVRPSEKTLELDPETPDYRVTFLDGVFQNCTCKAGLEWGKTPKCYHALQLIEREKERRAARLDALNASMSRIMDKVESGTCTEAYKVALLKHHDDLMNEATALVRGAVRGALNRGEQLDIKPVTTNVSTKGTLSSNRGFSLMR